MVPRPVLRKGRSNLPDDGQLQCVRAWESLLSSSFEQAKGKFPHEVRAPFSPHIKYRCSISLHNSEFTLKQRWSIESKTLI